MKEAITQHKFNSFELELIGYLTSIINEISQVEFNLCPIYNSLIDLIIKKKNNATEINLGKIPAPYPSCIFINVENFVDR